MIIFNRGSVRARGGSQIGIYLVTDKNQISRSARKLAQCSIGRVQPHGEYRCSVDPIIPADVAPGTYYVAYIIDELNSVVESDESNNTRVVDHPTVITR